MAEDDQPPEHIWLDSEALSQHFDRVRQRYKAGSSSGGSEPIAEESFETNDMTAGLMKGR